MANNTLLTRILICNDTTVNWGTSSKVLLKGEMGIEFTESGTPKIKIGNGTDTFTALPYVTMTPSEISTAINNAVTTASHSHSNKSILDSIQVALTTALKNNYDAAYTHSTQAHAPSNAERNTIVGIQQNGTDLTIDASTRKVNVTVPTKLSQLTNDAGFKTTDNNTTYDLGASASATNGNVKINLTGSDSTTDAVSVKGSGSVTVTSDANGVITVTGTDTKYTHPSSGVTAGTYKSVTVNAQGHVTAGTNPTTLAGYGITDAASKTHQHGNADITSLDASKLTGTIDIERLPQGALERCVVVADDTARFALTATSVQTGDTVKVTSTGKMYFVIDDTKLSTEAGYEVYTAGSATSVPWSGVTGKPSTFTPSAHTQAISTITGLQSKLDAKAENTDMTGATASTAGTHGLVPAPAAGKQNQYLRGDGTWATPTNTTYSDATTTTHGLMSVADKTKLDGIAENANNYVHPTTAGNKHIPSGGTSGQILRWSADGTAVWGDDKDTTYSAFKAATADTAGGTGLVPAPAAGAQAKYLRADGTWQTPPNTTYSAMTGATADAAGKTGLVPAPAAGKQTAFLRGDGKWATPTNTDTKVTQTLTSTSADYPVLLAPTGQTATATTTSYFGTGLQFNPSTKTLSSTTFKGALSGNATSASKLATSRSFSITGAATASAIGFTGERNVALNVTSLDAVKLTLNTSDTLILNGGGAD